VPLRNVEQNKAGQPSTEKDFETQHSGVFAPPGLPLAPFSTAESGLKEKSQARSKASPAKTMRLCLLDGSSCHCVIPRKVKVNGEGETEQFGVFATPGFVVSSAERFAPGAFLTAESWAQR
jgi:hypothetical protein